MMPHPTAQWVQMVRRYSVCTSGRGKFFFSSCVASRTQDKGQEPQQGAASQRHGAAAQEGPPADARLEKRVQRRSVAATFY